MNLHKFFCGNCNQKLGVPHKYISEEVECTRCKLMVVVPEVALIKSTPKDAIVEEHIEEAKPQPVESDSIWSDDMFTTHDVETEEQEALNQEDELDVCPRCSGVYSGQPDNCPDCGFELNLPDHLREAQGQKNSMGSFWQDLVKSTAPIRSAGDLVPFIMIFLGYVYVDLMPVFNGYVLASKAMVMGYISAFYFNVILDIANGENDLPLVDVSEIWDSLIRPFLLFIVSYLYAYAPAVIYLVFEFFNIVSGQPLLEEDNNILARMGTIFLVMIAAGVFAWPMIILTIALGDSFIIKPHLVIISIGRMFLPYLACVVFLGVCTGLLYLASDMTTAQATEEMPQGMFGAMSGGYIVAVLLLNLTIASGQIFTMKSIGLLYRHYGDRMDW